ncbi:MAG: hypothetical protein M1825_000336 [Sarcosagium campestre]|nr:MAG: hypothetical protein M1825_000336 [Sarcosagium campestre]
MWILPLLGTVGLLLGFLFLTLALASGLYYLSELVEEHTVITKRILNWLIYTVIGAHVVLVLIDGFPKRWALLSVISHLVYQANLRRFPLVKLTDTVFILSCALVVLNHWAWFRHFSGPPSTPPPDQARWSSSVRVAPTFTEVASFFGICVWLVPFALFVSLSAGDNVLPTAAGSSDFSNVAGGSGGGGSHGSPMLDEGVKKKGMAKAVVDGFREWMGETGELMGVWKGDRLKRF